MKPAVSPTIDELRQSARSLRRWLSYVELKIKELGVKGIRPNAHILELKDLLYSAYTYTEDALSNASEFDDL